MIDRVLSKKYIQRAVTLARIQRNGSSWRDNTNASILDLDQETTGAAMNIVAHLVLSELTGWEPRLCFQQGTAGSYLIDHNGIKVYGHSHDPKYWDGRYNNFPAVTEYKLGKMQEDDSIFHSLVDLDFNGETGTVDFVGRFQKTRLETVGERRLADNQQILVEAHISKLDREPLSLRVA